MPSNSIASYPLLQRAHPTLSARLRSKDSTIQESITSGLSSGRKHIVFTIVLAMTIVQWALVVSFWRAGPSEGPLGEAHGLVPDFGTTVVRFNSTREDGARAMDSSDSAWTKLIPDTLPPPIQLNGDDIFSVSVFHQLHCLHYILKEFNKLLHPNETSHHSHDHTAEQGDDHGGESQEEALKHVGHCFDYVRNSLMCCGYVAFEGQGSDIEDPGTLGEASYHVCKNYDAIKAWAQASRATNMEGFSD
ncbi:hypothetical protein Daus18300_002490 [Diaporthe australafricana]|uniref:Oxidase ustYa n=1 Tax=Diaporthe australafricana TaxID=127596 RepID=A0ABR3XNE2_9PEZI